VPPNRVCQVRDLKRRSAAAAPLPAAAAPPPAAVVADGDVPYIETLTHIFEVVALVYLQHLQLALFPGGGQPRLGALQDAAAQQQLAVFDAYVEDIQIAKRAHPLRSKQVPRPAGYHADALFKRASRCRAGAKRRVCCSQLTN
jgi:hypothetical protein